MYTTRPVLGSEEIVTENGMVVAQHPLAAEIGLDVLTKGANAGLAAVCINVISLCDLTSFCINEDVPLAFISRSPLITGMSALNCIFQ